LRGVPFGGVLERVEIEITAELAIDASQQILVELRSDTSDIVVSSDESVDLLEQVHSDEQRAPHSEDLARTTQKSIAPSRVRPHSSLGYKTPEEFRKEMGYADAESKERFPHPHSPDYDCEMISVAKLQPETLSYLD
jgi:hypothetical protein